MGVWDAGGEVCWIRQNKANPSQSVKLELGLELGKSIQNCTIRRYSARSFFLYFMKLKQSKIYFNDVFLSKLIYMLVSLNK